MEKIAISVKNVSKTFFIPHEKISTLRGFFINFFKKKRYEEFNALDHLSFEVKKGEFFGIIGRNGSGKSTLLKILAGIYTPDDGSIEIDGLISPFLELGIGFNPELSGRDNVYLNATVLGMTKKQIDEKFNSIVTFSELERFIDQKVKNYSSGMQVRLAFSVAIHANREILLMDEVLAVGDANFQQKCIEEFRRYKELGKTVILVTHDLVTLERYCDRAMLIRNGRVQYLGEPQKAVALYMEQNVSDEEKRLVSGEHHPEDLIEKSEKTEKKQANLYSESPVRIQDIEFLNADNEKKHVFQTGEPITLRIHYKSNRPVEQPAFGIDIYTDDDIHITGPNTLTSKFVVPTIQSDGSIDCLLESNPFYAGTLKITASVFDAKIGTLFDYRDREFSCKIISAEPNQNGVIKLDHIWKIK